MFSVNIGKEKTNNVFQDYIKWGILEEIYGTIIVFVTSAWNCEYIVLSSQCGEAVEAWHHVEYWTACSSCSFQSTGEAIKAVEACSASLEDFMLKGDYNYAYLISQAGPDTGTTSGEVW